MDTKVITTPDIKTEKPALKKPPMYKVILYNDDYTPMDFVVELLIRYFKHNEDSATNIMMHIHQSGQAICGIFPKDIAESKVVQVEIHCQQHHYPLRCNFEEQTGDQ
ncbi:MAG: ATP-dependent Clp protease adapter ClpS [Mariprofundaceae bacterium]